MSNNKIFQKERLIQARRINNLTQQKLADLCGISASAISQYENGEIDPSSENIVKISCFLKTNINFFYKPKPAMFIKNIAFRKKKGTEKEVIKQSKDIVEYLNEIKTSLVDKYVDTPKLNLPNIEYKTNFNSDEIDFSKIEKIAKDLRIFWGINDYVVSDMIKLLEGNGIFVFKLKTGEELLKIDALSWLNNEKDPIILLTKNKSAVRSRFDLAHELGHIILHRNQIINEDTLLKDIAILEEEANYFAGCFLLPSEKMENEFIGHNIEFLKEIKKKWKVSISAIAVRLKNLCLINHNQYEYIFKTLNKLGFKKQEPLDNEIPHEEMYLFKEILKHLKVKLSLEDNFLCIDTINDCFEVELKEYPKNIINFYIKKD